MFIAKLGQEDVVVLTCRKDVGREKESGGGGERRGRVGERGGGRGKERERERERERESVCVCVRERERMMVERALWIGLSNLMFFPCVKGKT